MSNINWLSFSTSSSNLIQLKTLCVTTPTRLQICNNWTFCRFSWEPSPFPWMPHLKRTRTGKLMALKRVRVAEATLVGALHTHDDMSNNCHQWWWWWPDGDHLNIVCTCQTSTFYQPTQHLPPWHRSRKTINKVWPWHMYFNRGSGAKGSCTQNTCDPSSWRGSPLERLTSMQKLHFFATKCLKPSFKPIIFFSKVDRSVEDKKR